MHSTCVYLKDRGRWLFLLRNRKKKDVNRGKWIGVGGKCLEGESYEDCARREVFEETGLSVRKLTLSGMVLFVYPGEETEEIAVYSSDSFEGELHDCEEGTLAWIDEGDIMNLELWEGDRIFLKKMLAGDGEPFDLRLYYDDHGNLLKAEERPGGTNA